MAASMRTSRLIQSLLGLVLLAAVSAGSACSESAEEIPSTSSGGGGQTSESGSGGQASQPGSGGAEPGSGGQMNEVGSGGTLAKPDCAPPEDLGVRLVGRYDGCSPGGVRMAWSGSGFIARFDGTGLSMSQSGSAVQYTVLVDSVIQPVLKTESGEQNYELASGLEPGEHVVEVYRRGEASFGATTLLAVNVTGGALLEPPARAARRIEVFGDSITCGYGNEGANATCPFSADTENHYLSYGAILARRFDADLSTVAWSGKGVVINYGGEMSTTLPEMVERAIPGSESSVWDYSLEPAPQVVLINLGTNDFSTENDPTPESFLEGYLGMLRGIRARYPEALILCTIGPLLSGPDLTKAESGIQSAVEQLTAAGDTAVFAYKMQTGNANPGCDWHPGLATHEAMAEELGVALSAQLGW